MEWISGTIDDALFESMLTPLAEQVLERILLREGRRPGSPPAEYPSAILVFHRELGLLLLTAESRKVMPKASPGLSLDAVKTALALQIVSDDRPKFRSLFEKGTAMDLFALLPGSVEGARSLFFWTGSWPWGRVVFFQPRTGNEEGGALPDHFRQFGDTLPPVLSPILDSWMLDATLEVFWSRVLLNMTPEFQPGPGLLSPEWFRKVSPRVEDQTEKGNILLGRYQNDPGRGWTRTVELLEKGRAREDVRSLARIPDPKNVLPGTLQGRSIDIPVDLFGIFELGFVRVPSGVIKVVGFSEFFSRLRRSKTMAMRSLYRHLLYSGQLEPLNFWVPETECFSLRMLEKVDRWLGEEIMDDPFVAVALDSVGRKKTIEAQLRPFDLLFGDERRMDKIFLLLRHCPKEKVTGSVIPRLLRLEGMDERQFSSPVSLREYLAKREA
jgi:hypothetical protein